MSRQKRGISVDFEKTVDHYYLDNPENRYDPIKIPIKMLRDISGKTTFSCIDTDRNIKVLHESIDEVMIEVDNILKNRADIIWSKKLAITMNSVVIDKPQRTINNMNPLRLINLTFSLKVIPIETGIDGSDEKWERDQGSNFIKNEQLRSGFHANWKDVPEDIYRDKDESNILIDDTPENRIAIMNLAEGFRGFLKRVHDVFEPDQIEQTIGSLIKSSGYLLSAGEPSKLYVCVGCNQAYQITDDNTADKTHCSESCKLQPKLENEL